MKFIKKIITFIKIFYQKRKNRKLLKKQKSQPVGMNYVDLRKETNVLDVDLIGKGSSEELMKKVRQFTKVIITTFTIASILWITWSYILATYAMIILANVEPMSSLSEKVCDVISKYILVYCLKAFFETFAENGMKLIENHINKDVEHSELCDVNDNEPVG